MKRNTIEHSVRASNRYCPECRQQKKHNILIRETGKECGAFGYQIAELLGISVESYTRMMRHELPMSEQEEIADLIRKEFGKQEVDNG